MSWILKNRNKSVFTVLLSSLARKWKQISISLASFDNKNRKVLFVAFFLVFGIFAFNVEKSFAVDVSGMTPAAGLIAHTKSCTDTGGTGYDSSSGKCTGCPQGKSAEGDECRLNADLSYSSAAPVQGGALKDLPAEAAGVLGGAFTEAIGWILTQVHALVGWLFAIAATLFSWVIEPANISGPNGLLNKQAVKDVWTMVRDLLNMIFILVLLFAAFCTIFQIEKWNLKKVWLNVLINALLVNFSYPIARFFIDVSNVAFYYFVNNLFSATGTVTGSGIFAMFGTSSSISAILKPDAFTGNAIAYQLAMIVMTFIMGMTLMVIAALFIVRLIALTMLVMFSPVGFVGYIFPATQSYADDWWKKLFSYSFFAPIMIFIMAIALRVAEALKAENFRSLMANASANTPADQSTWIANAAFFTIPIIILWMGMGVAQKMGIEGADKVVGAVKKGGKALAMGLSGGNWAKKNYDAFSASRKKRADEIGKKRWGGNLGDKANDAQDRLLAGAGSPKAQKRYNDRKVTDNKDEIKKQSEKHETTSEIDLHDQTKNLDAATLATMTDVQVQEAAGKVKQAHSRGAKYENHIEGELKKQVAGHVGFSGVKPADVKKAVINATMAAGAIAMERDREKSEKDALDKWIREEKVARMAQERAIVKFAEEKGKI